MVKMVLEGPYKWLGGSSTCSLVRCHQLPLVGNTLTLLVFTPVPPVVPLLPLLLVHLSSHQSF